MTYFTRLALKVERHPKTGEFIPDGAGNSSLAVGHDPTGETRKKKPKDLPGQDAPLSVVSGE